MITITKEIGIEKEIEKEKGTKTEIEKEKEIETEKEIEIEKETGIATVTERNPAVEGQEVATRRERDQELGQMREEEKK